MRVRKAKQKAVYKTPNTKATVPGQRNVLDMSGPFEATPIGSKYRIQVVDDYSRFGVVAFCKRRSDLANWAQAEILVKFHGMGYKIEFLRCDNAGENTKPYLSVICNEYRTSKELTALDTPQQNGVVERRIVWQALRKQFQPVEIDDYIDLSNRFKKCEMETEFENPSKWI
jgi:hypothetical protein